MLLSTRTKALLDREVTKYSLISDGFPKDANLTRQGSPRLIDTDSKRVILLHRLSGIVVFAQYDRPHTF